MPPNVRPRGPLPARVYWIRRLVVLGVPLLLVVVLAKVLGGSSDGQDTPAATQVGARTEAPAQEEARDGPGEADEKAQRPRKKKRRKPVLAQPSGPCEASDITATPDVRRVPGGSDVPLLINLRTRTAEACTWQVSPDTFAVSITSGSDNIWSTRECTDAIRPRTLVVRKAVDTRVRVVWHARRSDETCSRYTDWARPGYYHAQAAALGGDATDVQFRLVPPSAPVITKTVKPKPEPKPKKPAPRKTKQPSPDDERSHVPGEDGGGNRDG